MRDTTNFASGLMFAAVVAVLMSGLLASPLQLNAQNCSRFARAKRSLQSNLHQSCNRCVFQIHE